jgi:hypothetical protein
VQIIWLGGGIGGMEKHKKNYAVWFGLLLIAAALIIWLCSIIEIKSDEIMLTTQNLSMEEVWRYEGALQWWENAYFTAVLPAAGILTISGLGLMSSPHIRGFIQKGSLKKQIPASVKSEAFSSKERFGKNQERVQLILRRNIEVNLMIQKNMIEMQRQQGKLMADLLNQLAEKPTRENGESERRLIRYYKEVEEKNNRMRTWLLHLDKWGAKRN